jgi:hypothetical protein
MTDLDAINIAVLDLHETKKRLQNKQTDEDLIKQVCSFIAHRLSHFDEEASLQSIASFDPKKGPASHRIAIICLETIGSFSQSLEPEQRKAFLTWLGGSGEELGYTQGVLGLQIDKNSQAAIEGVSNATNAHLAKMTEQENKILNMAQKHLSSHSWRIIKNLLSDSAFCAKEDDGETCSHKRKTAISVALKLLKRKQSQQQWMT